MPIYFKGSHSSYIHFEMNHTKKNICTYYVDIMVYFNDYTTIYYMFIFSYWLNPPNPKSTLPRLAKRQEAEKRIGATRATELTSWQLTVKMGWKPGRLERGIWKEIMGVPKLGDSDFILYLFWLFDVWCFWYHWLFPIYILKASLEIRCSLDSHRYKILVKRENRDTPED